MPTSLLPPPVAELASLLSFSPEEKGMSYTCMPSMPAGAWLRHFMLLHRWWRTQEEGRNVFPRRSGWAGGDYCMPSLSYFMPLFSISFLRMCMCMRHAGSMLGVLLRRFTLVSLLSPNCLPSLFPHTLAPSLSALYLPLPFPLLLQLFSQLLPSLIFLSGRTVAVRCSSLLRTNRGKR